MYRRAALHVYRLYQKTINVGLASGIVGVVLVSSLVSSPAASAISIGGPSDCDDNAIVHCGVHSTSEVINSYNSSAYVRGVYAAFGISQADIANLPSNDVAGRVTKDGNVFIDSQSQAVATNAVTGGRDDIEPGSTKLNYQGAIFYKRPPSVSFQQDSLPAFVSMQNGVFQFAVIASCGNAVRASATQQATTPNSVGQGHAVSAPQAPAKPQAKPATTPTPAPTQTQSQTQSQEVNVTNNNTNTNNQATVAEQSVKTTPAPSPAPTPAQAAPSATATVQPATQATAASLPNTGPAGTVGVFIISAALGMFGYRRLLMAKLGN